MSYGGGRPYNPMVPPVGEERWTSRQQRVERIRRSVQRLERMGAEDYPTAAAYLRGWRTGELPPPLTAEFVLGHPGVPGAEKAVIAHFINNLSGSQSDRRWGYPLNDPLLLNGRPRVIGSLDQREYAFLADPTQDPLQHHRYFWESKFSPVGGRSDAELTLGRGMLRGNAAVKIEQTHPGMMRVAGPVEFAGRDRYDWDRYGLLPQALAARDWLTGGDMRFLEEHGGAAPFDVVFEPWRRDLDAIFVQKPDGWAPFKVTWSPRYDPRTGRKFDRS